MEVIFALSPMLLVLVGAGCLVGVDHWEGRGGPRSTKHRANVAQVGTLVFLWAAVLSFAVGYATRHGARIEVLAPYYVADSFGSACSFLICLSAAVCLVFGEANGTRQQGRVELLPMLAITTVGALALSGATDLVTIIVCMPLLSVGIGGLCGLKAESARAKEAVLKHWLLNGFGSAAFLFGAGSLYGATGQTSLHSIGNAVAGGMLAGGTLGPPLLAVGLTLMLVGFAVRVGAAPFHMWLPDVHEGVSVEVAAYLTSAVKVATFGVLSRMLLVPLGGVELSAWGAGWPPVVATIAICTSLLGALLAARQDRVQRMLGYLSLAHSGCLLSGLVALRGQPEALSFVAFYLFAHVVAWLGAYGCLVGSGPRREHPTRNCDLAGLARRWPVWGLCFGLLMVTVAGLPPTVGFFGRVLLLGSLVEQGYFALAITSSIVGVLTVVCCFRLVASLFAGGPSAMPTAETGPPRGVRMVTAALALGVLYSGLFPPV